MVHDVKQDGVHVPRECTETMLQVTSVVGDLSFVLDIIFACACGHYIGLVAKTTLRSFNCRQESRSKIFILLQLLLHDCVKGQIAQGGCLITTSCFRGFPWTSGIDTVFFHLELFTGFPRRARVIRILILGVWVMPACIACVASSCSM